MEVIPAVIPLMQNGVALSMVVAEPRLVPHTVPIHLHCSVSLKLQTLVIWVGTFTLSPDCHRVCRCGQDHPAWKPAPVDGHQTRAREIKVFRNVWMAIQRPSVWGRRPCRGVESFLGPLLHCGVKGRGGLGVQATAWQAASTSSEGQ